MTDDILLARESNGKFLLSVIRRYEHDDTLKNVENYELDRESVQYLFGQTGHALRKGESDE